MTAAETSAVDPLAAHQNVPLELTSIADDRLRDIYGAPFALVRPDQHVAWRGERLMRWMKHSKPHEARSCTVERRRDQTKRRNTRGRKQ